MDPDYGPEGPPEPEPVNPLDVLTDEELAELADWRETRRLR